MSEPENFIARWSRRKRESAEEEAEATKPAAASGVPDETAHTEDDRGEAGRRLKRLPPRATSGRSSGLGCRLN